MMVMVLCQSDDEREGDEGVLIRGLAWLLL